MEINALLKAVIDADAMPVVICDLEHTIVYMNPAACSRYSYAGGASMVGRSIMDCHSPATQQRMRDILAWFQESPEHNLVLEEHNRKEDKDVFTIALRDPEGTLIGYYEKHEGRTWFPGEPYEQLS